MMKMSKKLIEMQLSLLQTTLVGMAITFFCGFLMGLVALYA